MCVYRVFMPKAVPLENKVKLEKALYQHQADVVCSVSTINTFNGT